MANETETDEEQLAESEAFNPPRGGMVDETFLRCLKGESCTYAFNPPRGGMVDETTEQIDYYI